MKSKLIKFTLLIVFLFFSETVFGAIGDWEVYETKHFVVFFPEGYQEQAQQTLYFLEEYRESIKELTGNKREFKTLVVLQDTGLYSNANANALNYKINIYTTTPETYSEIGNVENWFRNVSVHEYTHILQMTNISGPYVSLNKYLGNYIFPNVFNPDWVMEGIAVYNESQNSPYEGRLNDGYYDAVIASKTAAGSLPSLIDITYGDNHYPRGHWYLYGAEFFAYLAERYGEEKFAEYFSLVGSSPNVIFPGIFFPSAGIDKIAQEVYGKSFPELFNEWKDHLQQKYTNWKIEGEKIIENRNGKIYGLTYNSGNFYYFKEYFLEPGPYETKIIIQLAEYNLETGQERIIDQFNKDVNPFLQVYNGKLYYSKKVTEDGYANVDNQGFGLTAKLYSYDLLSRRSTEILKAEFKDFVVIPGGKILYTKVLKDGSGSEVWSYQDGNNEQLGKVSEIVGEINFFNNKIVVVSKSSTGSWNINQLNLEDLSLSPLVNSPYAEKLIKIIDDKLYFTANYDRQYSVYQYTDSLLQVDQLTNNPYSREGIIIGDNIYFVGLTADGEAIYCTEKKNREIEVTVEKDKEFNFSEMGNVAGLTTLDFTQKNYSYLLKPYTYFPFLSGSDALGLNTYYIDYLALMSYTVTTRNFMPLTISLSGNIAKTELLLDYPLYQSTEPGLSRVELNYRTDFSKNYPGITLTFSGTKEELNFKIFRSIDGSSNYNQAVYRHIFNKGALKIEGVKIDSYDLEARPRDTGFFAEMPDGWRVSLDLIGKMGEIRDGFWSPNLYFGDIYGKLFADYNCGGDEEEIVYGGELLLEAGGQLGIQYVPVLGVNCYEDEVEPYFEIKLSL